MPKELQKYIRLSAMPTPFCPGCGHGILMTAILHAIDESGLDINNMVFVSGIGCAGWIPSPHFNADTLHTTHGRPIVFATGVKLANPKLKVVVISGDGDLASIGGNHLIHAARRDMPITVICANNGIYGMTGGQASSTTPVKAISKTSPAGNIERPFDLCKLVIGAGAGYAARFPVAPIKPLIKSIINALNHQGFSFIDVLSPCPTYFGRMNKMKRPVEMFDDLKKRCRKVKNGEKIKEGLIPIGEFVD